MTPELELLDWKRRIFDLYAEVRASEPRAGWERWRAVRAELFRDHPQSPSPGYTSLAYYDYDPALRFLADVEPMEQQVLEIAGSAGSLTRFRRFARASFERGSLELYWLEAYGGGIFLPIADETRGQETYGAGRYLLDTVKGSDLGMEDGRLVLDFNFAYNPSCAYDDEWACPLSPPANRLPMPIRAGERLE
ncbi:MAG TPA: DUF1684 domain-containing protein [Gaiellaceae bacterium]|nr:DUF1684 domain-containing protein [Gaiellaceae bacterium]